MVWSEIRSFPTISISDTDVVEILDVYDSDGNSFRLLVANDRPSALRGIFLVTQGIGNTINEAALAGYYGAKVSKETGQDMESEGIHAAALIVRELCTTPSSWRSKKSLNQWLLDQRVPVMEGVDTRALVRVLRSEGEVNGLMVPSDSLHTLDLLREEAMALPSMVGQNLARVVSTREPYFWPAETENEPFSVVAYDFGIKHNILRLMATMGMSVTIVPWNSPAEVVSDMKPDGVFLSNGPGDPAAVEIAVEEVRRMLGQIPIFGICLGHQILGLALGCSTYKLHCGHHGGNHPVMDFQSGKIEITSHNHGFSVEEKSLPSGVRVTHRNLNDQTVEGLESVEYPAYSVQYHPEAAPGPHDARYLFERFSKMMQTHLDGKT